MAAVSTPSSSGPCLAIPSKGQYCSALRRHTQHSWRTADCLDSLSVVARTWWGADEVRARLAGPTHPRRVPWPWPYAQTLPSALALALPCPIPRPATSTHLEHAFKVTGYQQLRQTVSRSSREHLVAVACHGK